MAGYTSENATDIVNTYLDFETAVRGVVSDILGWRFNETDGFECEFERSDDIAATMVHVTVITQWGDDSRPTYEIFERLSLGSLDAR